MGALSIDLEPIYAALFNLAKTCTTPNLSSRVFQPLDAVDTANLPALFQHQVSEENKQVKGIPDIILGNVDLYLYASTQGNMSEDDAANSAALLNGFVTAMRTALAPDPVTGVQTLGGLVTRCWIAGKTEVFEDTQGQRAAVVMGVQFLVSDSSAQLNVFDSGYMYAQLPSGDWVQVGALQDVNIRATFKNTEERGNFTYVMKTMNSVSTISAVARLAQINGKLMSQVVFGAASVSTGSKLLVPSLAITVPAGGPYTVTPAGPGGGTWSQDLGVVYATGANAGIPLTVTSGAPAQGQYAVVAGVYTFAAADASAGLQVSFLYSLAGGNTLTLANQYTQLAPLFKVVLNTTAPGGQVTWVLNACRSEVLQFPTRQEDYAIPEFTFSVQADGSGNIGTMSYSR